MKYTKKIIYNIQSSNKIYHNLYQLFKNILKTYYEMTINTFCGNQDFSTYEKIFSWLKLSYVLFTIKFTYQKWNNYISEKKWFFYMGMKLLIHEYKNLKIMEKLK